MYFNIQIDNNYVDLKALEDIKNNLMGIIKSIPKNIWEPKLLNSLKKFKEEYFPNIVMHRNFYKY